MIGKVDDVLMFLKAFKYSTIVLILFNVYSLFNDGYSALQSINIFYLGLSVILSSVCINLFDKLKGSIDTVLSGLSGMGGDLKND